MSQVDAGLRSLLRSGAPSKIVHLIIHPDQGTSLDQAANMLNAEHIQVRRKFSLTHSLAASASVTQAKRLSRLPWIGKIEEDKTVHAM